MKKPSLVFGTKQSVRYLDIYVFKSLGNITFVVSSLELYVCDFFYHLLPTQLRFTVTAPYLMLPFDQREESLIKNCIKRLGSFFLLLDYEPTKEEVQYYDTPLTLTTPHFPLDLLGLEKELPKSSSIYCQESIYSSDQAGRKNPEETTCTQDDDSPMGSSQEIEDWTPEEIQ